MWFTLLDHGKKEKEEEERKDWFISKSEHGRQLDVLSQLIFFINLFKAMLQRFLFVFKCP